MNAPKEDFSLETRKEVWKTPTLLEIHLSETETGGMLGAEDGVYQPHS